MRHKEDCVFAVDLLNELLTLEFGSPLGLDPLNIINLAEHFIFILQLDLFNTRDFILQLDGQIVL